MKRISIFLIFSLLFSGFINCQTKMTSGPSEPARQQPSKLEIFLLIGQSNMAGRAEIEAVDRDSLNGVFLYTGTAGKEWEKAANPLNKYSTVRKDLSMQKLGPGYTFAKEIASSLPGKQIGLVVNARGGTAISEWMPGANLYNEAVKRAKEAMKYGTLKGIVWHQGESDVSRTDQYIQNLATMIQALRNDLGLPNLPFVAGQLSEANPSRIPFNKMILGLSKVVNNTGVITTESTATIDSTHFNSASQRLLGERYAKEMVKLLK